MIALVAAAAVLAADVLAIVNGQPITRAELARALSAVERQSYEDAAADLQDAEHAAVREYLGRQAVERESKLQRVAADSIYGRVLAADFDRFDANLRNRIQQQRERVFALEQGALERLVQQRLFAAAARARGTSAEELTRALAAGVAPATRSDLEFIKAYEASKQQISATVPPGEGRLAVAIHDARIEQLRMAVIDSVRGRTRVETRLAPPRVAVPAASATRIGSSAAAIRIVVFTDFECPYCLEGEQVLSQIRKQYGDRV